MTESRWVRIGLRAFTQVVLAFLYLPLVVLAVYAFNESRTLAWPPTGLTLHWFGEAASNPRIIEAFWSSVAAAVGATAIALVLGTLAALSVQPVGGQPSVSAVLNERRATTYRGRYRKASTRTV